MNITYKTRKIEKICEDKKVSVKSYGIDMANKIKLRINEIRASDSVEEMIQYQIGRCHALVGYRYGEYALDLIHPFRLIFVKDHGTKQIRVVKIIEITDYHKK